MKASTVFALAVSLLIGLAAAAGAKYAGLFDRKPPEPPAPPKPPIPVLVAQHTLFANFTLTANQVRVRDLSPQEQADLQARFGANWQDRLLPANTAAAHWRTPLRTIQADEYLFEKDFAPASLPDELTKQLEPNTRAVSVSVMKDKCAGGSIRVGEYVNVMMTTKVAVDDREELRTACIARACRVVAKRNMLWQVLLSDPDDKPVQFTLQANPYRASLIEYALSFGQVSLQPVPAPPKTNGTFSDLSSPEYAQEDKRVEEIDRGTRLIGMEDLARIFKILPTTPKPPPPQPVVIQHLSGVQQAAPTIFYVNGVNPAAAPGHPQSVSGVGSGVGRDASNGNATQSANTTFQLPNAAGGSGCKDCDAKRKAAEEAAKYGTIRAGN